MTSVARRSLRAISGIILRSQLLKKFLMDRAIFAKIFKILYGTTTVLRNHLKAAHAIAHCKLSKKDAAKKEVKQKVGLISLFRNYYYFGCKAVRLGL